MKALLTTLLLTSLMLGQSGQPKLECFGDLNGTVEPCTKLMQQERALHAKTPTKFTVFTSSRIMICNSVPNSEEVRDCKIEPGHTLDEAVNAMLRSIHSEKSSK